MVAGPWQKRLAGCCWVLGEEFGLSDVAADGEEGDDVADEGYTGDGGEDVLPLEDYGVGIHEEAAGHLDEAEVLLEQGKHHPADKSADKSTERDHPSLKPEDPPDK